MSSPHVVGRLAPSPTGLLHLGHARTFLVAWWQARALGGSVLLRMEDLDRSRVRRELADQILSDLEWLGLDWDGPIAWQSERDDLYREAIAKLESLGVVYPCVCTRKEIETAASAPHESDGTTRYPGTCRGRFASLAQAEAETGRAAALRLSLADVRRRLECGDGAELARDEAGGPGTELRRDGEQRAPSAGAGPISARAASPKIEWREEGALLRCRVSFEDALLGAQTFDVASDVGDFPVTSRDGMVSYQLAVVVDDHEQGVTDVVRGEDLLASCARQHLVQRALELSSPRWWHVPLVVDAEGRRLAKRTDALSLAALRARGIDPRRIVSWAARESGLDVQAETSAAEALGAFDARRIPRSPVRLPANPIEALRPTPTRP